MKIAIAAKENHVRSQIDAHFGRCCWYCIFDTETKKTEFIENTACQFFENAGCEAVDFLLSKGIKVVIAGRFGSRVIEAFRANKVQMIVTEKKRTINEIIKQIK